MFVHLSLSAHALPTAWVGYELEHVSNRQPTNGHIASDRDAKLQAECKPMLQTHPTS